MHLNRPEWLAQSQIMKYFFSKRIETIIFPIDVMYPHLKLSLIDQVNFAQHFPKIVLTSSTNLLCDTSDVLLLLFSVITPIYWCTKHFGISLNRTRATQHDLVLRC